MRLVLPGGRSYTLDDPSRQGGILEPPLAMAASEAAASLITQQLQAKRAVSRSAPVGLFPSPPGFHELTASWSALSATPAPLTLHVETEKERQSWF